MNRIVVAVAWLLLACPCASAQDDASAAALQQWIDAVRQHQPGHADAAVGIATSMSYADRLRLNPAMQVFLRDLRAGVKHSRTNALSDIFLSIESVRRDPGVAPFLRRAAILHTDAAIHAEDFPAPPDDEPMRTPPLRVGPGESRSAPPPPLLASERFVVQLDGRVTGDVSAVWHWTFARSLIDMTLLRTEISRDDDLAFASAWYHAVAAYLFATVHYGDLNNHLRHAADVLPRDASLLFDRACYAEAMGLPLYQVVAADPDNRGSLARLAIQLPGEDETDAEAVTLFRLALEADPGYAEARVRLARLLERRGRRDEAAEHVGKALGGSKMDRAGTFYARLVAGRIAQARGRPTEALAHYSEAAALYPGAQSALLGASQAALLVPNLATSVSFVQRLGESPRDENSDPWWDYALGPGRDVKRLLAELYARVPR